MIELGRADVADHDVDCLTEEQLLTYDTFCQFAEEHTDDGGD